MLSNKNTLVIFGSFAKCEFQRQILRRMLNGHKSEYYSNHKLLRVKLKMCSHFSNQLYSTNYIRNRISAKLFAMLLLTSILSLVHMYSELNTCPDHLKINPVHLLISLLKYETVKSTKMILFLFSFR